MNPHADCDDLAILDEREQLLRDEGQFRDVIEKVCGAVSKIEEAKDESRRLTLYRNQDPKTIRKPIAELSGANADLWLALGALIAAQKDQASREVDGKTVGLTESWRAAVWDDLTQSNLNVARYDKVDMYESPKPQGERWVGSWPLGSGSFGNPHLFIQQDEHGQTRNRIVVKDCDFDRKDQRAVWDTDQGFWLKDHQDKDVPAEVKTMSDVRGRTGSEFIVEILSWRIAKERRLYRLYLEVYIL